MDCVHGALRRALRDVTRHYQKHFRGSGVRAAQFSVLARLMGSEPVALTILAHELEMDRTALSRDLDLLEKKNWVRSRSEDRDQRLRKVELTPKGTAAAAGALHGWKRAQASVGKILDHHGIRIAPVAKGANWNR